MKNCQSKAEKALDFLKDEEIVIRCKNVLKKLTHKA